jgi:thioester reductase-like protein
MMSIAKHILLTGATGVLGSELVPRLLRCHPGARLTLLLRPDESGSITRRLESATSPLGAEGARIDAVLGDVGVSRLGLSDSTRAELRRSVTHVIHGAATTRLNEAPEIARSVNLEGTIRALTFAESCRRLDLFAHVSTAYVCGDRQGLVRESDLWMGQRFLNAYEESKCHAEMRVRARSVEMPIVVFRPSVIVGDSRTGRISSFASLYGPLRHIAEGTIRRLPFSERASLDLIPVDIVADAIARLTARSGAAGETYHLCAGPERRVSMKRLLEASIRIAGRRDAPPLRFEPENARIERAPSGSRVFFDYLRFDRTFSTARVREHLGAAADPPADFLTPLFEYCRETDWGRRVPTAETVS